MIQNMQDIEKMAMKWGFLPFFECGIKGFSIAEHTPSELWFSDEVDGPWEWKGPLIGQGSLAYGKIFDKKAGFVSMEWLGHLINYRRAKAVAPLTPKEKEVYDCIIDHQVVLSKELKKLCGFVKPRAPRQNPLEKAMMEEVRLPRKRAKGESFDGIITRLQMSLRVCIADFKYNYDKNGKRYGWGVAEYTTPELMYGDEIVMPDCSPEESYRRMLRQILQIFPYATEKAVCRLLKI
ncbi:MAG: hypothetical protein IJS43_04360 [Bacteroidaceae bacterium]|nr:hypothetical protein [Bacteroidaceae bacterium]